MEENQLQCSKCGTEASDFESFCTNCGEFVEHNPVATRSNIGTEVATGDDRQWSMGAHLSPLVGFIIPLGHIIAPLIIWQMKKNSSEFIADQAKEALNFQISLTIYSAVAGLLCFVFIGYLILPFLGIGGFLLMIMAAMKANGGEPYRYPFILRLIK